jgi:hypothetical protein
MNPSWLSNNIKSILAVIQIVSSVAYFWMCSIRNIKPDPQILIAMVSAQGIVLGYFFGSSTKSEKQEQPTINKADNVNINTDGK